MYKVFNISLGSADRDFCHNLEIMGNQFQVSRVGTNGSLEMAEQLVRQQDGKVDILTLGGVNLCYRLGKRRYPLKEGQRLFQIPQNTPVVDGELTKAVLDVLTLDYLVSRKILEIKDRKVLFVSVLDRYYLAKAFEALDAKLIIGDALFALKLPVAFKSLRGFEAVGRFTLPLLKHIPLRYLYPLGRKQEDNRPCYGKIFSEAEIIAGDYHFIHRNMPEDLAGKTVITSTVTKENVRTLQKRGVKLLVTTSPDFQGRSYGSNVLEGILYYVIRSQGKAFDRYHLAETAKKIGWEPRVEYLNS